MKRILPVLFLSLPVVLFLFVSGCGTNSLRPPPAASPAADFNRMHGRYHPPPRRIPEPTPPPTPTPTATGPEALGSDGYGAVMRVDGNGNVDYAWVSVMTGGLTGISFRRSTDGGATFSPAVSVIPISSSIGYPNNIDDEELDAAGNISILWTTGAEGSVEGTYLTHSTDGGVTWTTTLLGPIDAFLAQLVVEPTGAINVYWLDGGLFLMRSTDGVTFSAPTQVASTTTDAADLVGLVGPQGQSYLFWNSAGNIFFAASVNATQTFSSLQLTTGGGEFTPVVDSQGNVNIAWTTNVGDTPQADAVAFTRSTDQGQTFATPTVINEPATSAFTVEPNGAIDFAFAAALVPTSDVYFMRSTDNGATFSTPVPIGLPPTFQFSGSGGAVVAANGNGTITVYFSDDTLGQFNGDDDIYSTSSTDGIHFTTPADITNSPNSTDYVPQVVVSRTGVQYLCWDNGGNEMGSGTEVFFDAIP